MTREELRAWLNRKPPLDSSWRDWFASNDDVLEELERIARQRCMLHGHKWAEERRGAPVTEFMRCDCCGKIGERL